MRLPLTDSCRCRCAQDSGAAAQRSLPELQQVGNLPHLPAVNLNSFAGSGMQNTVDALPAVAPTNAVQQYAQDAQVGHLCALLAALHKCMIDPAGAMQATTSLLGNAQAEHGLHAEVFARLLGRRRACSCQVCCCLSAGGCGEPPRRGSPRAGACASGGLRLSCPPGPVCPAAGARPARRVYQRPHQHWQRGPRLRARPGPPTGEPAACALPWRMESYCTAESVW